MWKSLALGLVFCSGEPLALAPLRENFAGLPPTVLLPDFCLQLPTNRMSLFSVSVGSFDEVNKSSVFRTKDIMYAKEKPKMQIKENMHFAGFL